MSPSIKSLQQLQDRFVAEWSEHDFPAALATAKEELVQAREALGAEHPSVVRALLDIGLASQANHLPDESQKAQSDAQTLLDQLRAQADRFPDDLRTADFLIFEADRLWNLVGDSPDVLEKFSRALAIREKLRGPEHRETAEALARLAEVENLRAHFAEAEPLYRRAVAAYEKAGEEDDPYVEKSLQGLGQTLLQLESPADAWPFLERALAWTADHDFEKRSLYYLLISAAHCRRALGDLKGAADFESRAAALLPKANPGEQGFHV